jgi:hypothetical protein
MTLDPTADQQPRYTIATNPDMLTMQSEPRVSFTGVNTRVFPLKASMNTLQDFCDNYLNFPDDGRDMKLSQKNYFRPAAPYVYFQMINYGKMATESENLGWIAQNEILFCVPLEWYKVDKNGNQVFHDWAMICPFIFVDNDMSLTTGREVYGWCKVRGWLDPVPTSWTEDPRNPRRLLSMSSEIFPKLYAGAAQEARTLIDVTQQQAPPLSPSLFTRRSPFNPLWGIPEAVRSSAGLMGDMFEVFTNLPILGFQRRDMSSLSRMSSRAMQNMKAMAPWLPLNAGKAPQKSADGRLIRNASSPQLYFNQLTLKQFRDAAEPSYACYQAVVNSRVTVDRYYDVGLLGAPNLMVGDLSGGFRLNVHEYPEQPIVRTLGLEVEETLDTGSGAPIATLKPLMPFWLSADLRYDTGTTVSWRGKNSAAWDERQFYDRGLRTDSEDHKKPVTKNRFNATRGPAIQEVAGPFNYPDTTIRVFPLMADPDKLQEFCDNYLNQLDGDDAISVNGNSFEPWGSYVYMVVTTYGDEEGGKMWAEKNNIGRIAEREISFCVPVKWMEITDTGAKLKTMAILTPYNFANSSRHVISEREINGRQFVHSVIKSDDDCWLRESGPVRSRVLASLKTLLIPALNVGQPAEMLDLITITEKDVEKYNEDIPWAVIKANWSPELQKDFTQKTSQYRSAADRWDEILQMFKDVCPKRINLNFLSLKQYRGTEWTNRACYQALVLLRKKFKSIIDIREIHKKMHVQIHHHAAMPIVQTLGLKVKAIDSRENCVIQYIEPIRPFFIRASTRDELGIKICSRVNSTQWSADGDAPPDPEPTGLDDHQRSLLEGLTEPKAVIEFLLSSKYGAHDQAYHSYDASRPIYMQGDFGKQQNSVVFNTNKRNDDNE